MAIQAGGVTFSRHKTVIPPKTGGGSVTPNASEDLSPWQPTPNDKWDLAKVRHLSRRAGFGLKPEEAEKLLQIGHKLSIDIYLIVPNRTIPERGTFLLPSGEIINMSAFSHQVAAWVWLMTNSPYQLQEKMALFWHDHFSTGISKVRYPELMGRTINLYRRHALGDFRQLLIECGIDPGMLYFLDNRLSRARKPNENWGRELMELYSMGVGGGYTETDIKQASRCFTGWRNVLDYAFFDPSRVWHDPGVKQVLGRTIDNRALGATRRAVLKDGSDVVDAILAHPSSAKFIVRKIWEYFVYEKPSQALVDKLAAIWRQDRYNIGALLETILRSKAFFSKQAMRSLVKSPVEFVVGMLRQTDTTNLRYIRAGALIGQMGLPIMAYPGPDGVKEGQAWVNAQSMINRLNFAKEAIERRAIWNRTALRSNLKPDREIRRKSIPTGTPEPIVDAFLEIFVDGAVPKGVRDNLVRYMRMTDVGPYPWSYPGANNRTRDEKLAGLHHLIFALPEFHIS